MCSSGKVRYSSRKIARHSRTEMEQLYEKKYIIYKCKQCGMFHLATKTTYGKSKKEGKTVQRNVLSIGRFYNVSYRTARLDEQRRRDLRGAKKAGKSNKRRGEYVWD